MKGAAKPTEGTWNGRKPKNPKTTKTKNLVGCGRPWIMRARPGRGVILYGEDTRYRLKLGKYFLQPIIEGIVVVKTGGENRAFLAQLACDPFALAANGHKLEKPTFTGTLLRADWDDNPIDGAVFEKGEMIRGFTNPANAAANPGRPALEN